MFGRLEHESKQLQHIGDLDMGIPPSRFRFGDDRVEVDSCPDWEIPLLPF